MYKNIKNISYNDCFWIQRSPNLISLGFKGLPNHTHITISFEDKSYDINFHITKNVKNSRNKPKITIACINKKQLIELIPTLNSKMFYEILKPLNLEEYKKNMNSKLGFLSFDSLENPEITSLLEQRLFDRLKDNSKLRKKSRIKIEGNIEKQLESIAEYEDIQLLILNFIVEFSPKYQKPIESGILISEHSNLVVIRIYEKWFTINPDLNLINLLNSFVGIPLANHLIWKTKRALVSLKNAKDFADTEHLNKPIRLIRNPAI